MGEDNWAHLDAVMGIKRRLWVYSRYRAGSFISQFSNGAIPFLCNAVVVQRSTLRLRLRATVTDGVGGASRDLCATVTVPKTKTSSVLHWWIPNIFLPLGILFYHDTNSCPFLHSRMQRIYMFKFNGDWSKTKTNIDISTCPQTSHWPPGSME